MEFNINNTVKVKLTDVGHEILKRDAHYKTFLTEDKNGWSEWQLWELMRVFGPHIWMGADLPFEATICLLGK